MPVLESKTILNSKIEVVTTNYTWVLAW